MGLSLLLSVMPKRLFERLHFPTSSPQKLAGSERPTLPARGKEKPAGSPLPANSLCSHDRHPEVPVILRAHISISA